jgi:hypothetical protein
MFFIENKRNHNIDKFKETIFLSFFQYLLIKISNIDK